MHAQVGDVIRVQEEFESNNKVKVKLERGVRGDVTKIGKNGRALIAFDGVAVKQWVFRSNFDKLERSRTASFLQQ